MLSKIRLKSSKFPSACREKDVPLDISKGGVVKLFSRYSWKTLIRVGIKDMLCRPWKSRSVNVVVGVILSKKSQSLRWLISCRVLWTSWSWSWECSFLCWGQEGVNLFWKKGCSLFWRQGSGWRWREWLKIIWRVKRHWFWRWEGKGYQRWWWWCGWSFI